MRAKIPMQINTCYLPFIESRQRYAVLMGGAGSGKSVAAAQKLILRLTTEKDHRILAIRKVRSTIRVSVYQLLVDSIERYGLSNEFFINKTEMRITHLPSGNELITAGLDDAEKIKSIAGITGIWCEEATELEEQDFNQLELRVRGETANYKQFILTFNPIDEQHWLKQRFFANNDVEVFRIRTTYRDNSFLDKEYVRHLTERVKANEQLYKIYVMGEWGKANPGGEFYKCFKISKHTGDVNYNSALPLHLSFDFNVHPYMTCTIWQLDGKKAVQINEICLPHPLNTTRHICHSFMKLYPIHNSGIFIYGDPSGSARDTRMENGLNDYHIITGELSSYKPQLRLLSKAPSIAMRCNFINSIFENNFSGIDLYIDSRCTNTINDYIYLKEEADGTKLKQRVKDSQSGISYEKYGHTSDANDYFICAAFSNEFDNYRRGPSQRVFSVSSRDYNKERSY